MHEPCHLAAPSDQDASEPEAQGAVADAPRQLPQLAIAMAQDGTLQSLLAEARRLEGAGNGSAVRRCVMLLPVGPLGSWLPFEGMDWPT